MDAYPLITVAELADLVGTPGLVIFDATWPVRGSDPHIPSARPFDIDGEMSDPDSDLPHTVPSRDAFERALRGHGVGRDGRVVVYDQKGLFSAARAWWMLRAFGFDAVQVLDGGLPAWRAAGQSITTDPTPDPARGDVVLREAAPGAFVGIGDVQAALARGDVAVLDARSRGRFAGTEPEPRPGMRGGHMPGAVNLPFTELQDAGRVRPLAELAALVDEAAGDRPIIASCGSGVTACVIALAATLAGRKDVSVYDGSWSEWGRPGGPEVVTGP